MVNTGICASVARVRSVRWRRLPVFVLRWLSISEKPQHMHPIYEDAEVRTYRLRCPNHALAVPIAAGREMYALCCELHNQCVIIGALAERARGLRIVQVWNDAAVFYLSYVNALGALVTSRRRVNADSPSQTLLEERSRAKAWGAEAPARSLRW